MAEFALIPLAPPELPALPPEGHWLLQQICRHQGRQAKALQIQRSRFGSDLLLSDDRLPSSAWYGDRQVAALIWPGDVHIEGDLIDDSADHRPILIVTGSLYLHSWLRGGMSAFIGGDLRASGFVVGHYNDSALFVGGDLYAAGYLPRARPNKDCPQIRPHQVGGTIHARTLDVGDIDDEDLRQNFDPGVLIEEAGDWYLDEPAVLAAAKAGRPVWRW